KIPYGSLPNQMGSNLPPIDLGSGKTAIAVSACVSHVCALLNDSSIKCWGDNTYGQLGIGDANERGSAPGQMGDNLPAVDLGAGVTARSVSCGNTHTCALLVDGRVKCWGGNMFGQLGLGDTTTRGDKPGDMGDALPAVKLGVAKTATAVVVGGAAS